MVIAEARRAANFGGRVRVAVPPSEDFSRGEEEQDRQKHDRRVLGDESQSDGEAAGEDALPGGRLEVAVEGVDRGEEEAGGGGVGGDEGGVGEDGGVEDEQGHRQQARAGAKHLAARQEEEAGEQQGEDADGHVDAEEEGIGGIVAAVAGIVAEEEFPAAVVGLGFEEAALAGRDFEVEREERQGGDEFHERRVLGVQAVLAVLPVHVAGEDVVAFVPAWRLLPGGQGNLTDHDEQKRGRRDPCPANCVCFQSMPSPPEIMTRNALDLPAQYGCVMLMQSTAGAFTPRLQPCSQMAACSPPRHTSNHSPALSLPPVPEAPMDRRLFLKTTSSAGALAWLAPQYLAAQMRRLRIRVRSPTAMSARFPLSSTRP